MLNFACNTIENAVVLCSQCHIKFDMMQDPGWTFFPSDLNYFIDYEANDYRRRVLAASNGVRESRLCPTATDYVTTQYQSGSVSPTAPGGLYRRVFLQKLHPHIPLDAIAAEKPWFGAPMAALRRAIHATGSFRTTAFRPDDLSKLRTLQSLYARPGPELAPLLLSAGSQLAAPTTDPQNDGPPSKKRRLPPDNKAEEESREILTDQTGEPHQTMAVSDWILGPQMSTEEIVSRYAHVF